MTNFSFETNTDFLPTITVENSEVAARLLRELTRLKGNDPWLSELKEEIKQRLKSIEITGSHKGNSPESIASGLAVVDYTFKRIAFA